MGAAARSLARKGAADLILKECRALAGEDGSPAGRKLAIPPDSYAPDRDNLEKTG
jgi:hypothetical protein